MRHTWSEWSLITAAVICRVRLSSGDRSLPRACTLVSSWVQGGSDERRVPHPRDGWRARMPGRIPPEAPRAKRRTKPLKEAAEPRTPDPRGERVRPAGLRPLTWTLPSWTLPLLHKSRSTTRTPDPLFILDTSSPLDTILLFLLNKSLSEAWRHTHCVCRLLLPPHWWRMRARRSLDSAVGQHPMTSSPLARKRSSWKSALGRRNDGDSLPATKWVSDVPFIVIYHVVGWGCRPKPGFSVPVPARCERESCPERNPCPAHSDRWSLVEEGSTPVWVVAGWRGCHLVGGCDELAASP